MNKTSLVPVLAALFTFGVQNQCVVAESGTVIASSFALNTGNLSSFLNKYAGMNDSARAALRASNEYKAVVDAVKALTSRDIMKLDLTHILSSMKNFMFYVPKSDDFARMIHMELYYKAHNNLDVRNVTRFWDSSSTESLKNSFNMMKEVEEGTLTYDWVKWFYGDFSKGLLNFIVEHKDGADFAAQVIKNGKFYSSDLSTNAKSKINDFEEKEKTNAAAEKITAEKNAETAMKSSSIEQLAEKYAKEYTASDWSEKTKVESIFKEKFSEEKGKLGKVYTVKSIKELMELQDELYKKIENSDFGAKELHRQWLQAQLEEAEEVLFSKLLLDPEMVEELSRRNNVSGRSAFRNKLGDFVKNNRSKFHDYYTKEYGEKSYDDLLNLKSTLDSKRWGTSEGQYWMIEEQLKVLEELVVKKKSHGLSAQEDVMQPTRAQKSIRVGKPAPLSKMDDADDMSDEDAENLAWWREVPYKIAAPIKISNKSLVDCLNKVLDKKLDKKSHRVIQALFEYKCLDEDEEKIFRGFFEKILKVNPVTFSKKSNGKTKYRVLYKLISNFEINSFFAEYTGILLRKVEEECKMIPLSKFNGSLYEMYKKHIGFESDFESKFIDVSIAILGNLISLPQKTIKKGMLLPTFELLGCMLRGFDEKKDAEVWNEINDTAKELKLTSRFIKDNLKISGMNKKSRDYAAVMKFADGLDVNNKKQISPSRRHSLYDTAAA